MRSSEFHQPIRRGLSATSELTRSVSRIRLGKVLAFTVVLLALSALGIAGCATEKPLLGSSTPSPLPHGGAKAVAVRPPTGSVSPGSTEEGPSVAQLKVWHRAVREEATGRVRGITWSGVDVGNKRIEIGLVPLRGDREQLEAAISRAKVPRETIDIEVGCQGGALSRIEFGILPSEELRRAIYHSLEVVSQADYGDTVSMTLTLRNISDEPVQFYTGSSPHDFVVSTVNDQEVWHWRCGKTFPAIMREIKLEPGEELVLAGEWEQMSNWGEPVPAGTYLIRGMLIMEPAGILVTPPQELEVLK